MNEKQRAEQINFPPEKTSDNRPKVEEVPEITEQAKVGLELKKTDFENFFEGMKTYRDEKNTLFLIESKSIRLAPVIQEFRRILKLGGAAEPDKMISAVIEVAQKEKDKYHFWQRVYNHDKMEPGTDLERFYRFFVKGLEQEAKASKKTAA